MVASVCTVIMGGENKDQHEAETEARERREHPLHLFVSLGLKSAKPQTLNTYKGSSL